MVVSRFLAQLIGFVTDVVVSLLGLRIILKLLGASTVAPFVTWIYDTTKPLLAPFQGMFPSPDIAPRLTLEFSAIFAIVTYSFVGYLITDVVHMMNLRTEARGKGK
ncbi:MAG TPA: YggT family protein [Patescibacteria group bacterium]|nr:YggT family protein [Patescibacteria group bacterium]